MIDPPDDEEETQTGFVPEPTIEYVPLDLCKYAEGLRIPNQDSVILNLCNKKGQQKYLEPSKEQLQKSMDKLKKTILNLTPSLPLCAINNRFVNVEIWVTEKTNESGQQIYELFPYYCCPICESEIYK